MKKVIIFLILILLMPLNINAKTNDFELSCEKESFKEFEDFTCRTKISGDFSYDKITFDVELSDGIILNEVRSNYTALWNVTNKKNTITAKINEKDLVTGTQEFGILLFSLSEYGNQKINIKNIVLTNSKENKTLILDDAKVDIKIESSENKLKEITIDGEKISSFSPNTSSYYIESLKEELEIIATPIDKNSTISGDGIIKLNPNERETIIPIIVTSENGNNKIYKLYIINKNIIEEKLYLSNIEIYDENNNIININFNKEIFEYNVELKSNIKKIKIKSFIDEEGISFIKDYKTQTIDINNGDSIALIKIKNEKGYIKTYILNINRLLDNKSSNAYLKTLSIKGYDLKFNKKIKQYYLTINKKSKNLIIDAIAEDKKASVSIVDNEDLKEGSLIKVIVTAENSRKNTYYINITGVKSNTIKIVSLFIIAVLLLGLIIKSDKKLLNKIKNLKNIIPKLKSKPKSTKKKSVPKKKTTSKQSNVKNTKPAPKKKTTSKQSNVKNTKPAPKKKTTSKQSNVKNTKPAPKKKTTSKQSNLKILNQYLKKTNTNVSPTKKGTSQTKKSTPNKKNVKRKTNPKKIQKEEKEENK